MEHGVRLTLCTTFSFTPVALTPVGTATEGSATASMPSEACFSPLISFDPCDDIFALA